MLTTTTPKQYKNTSRFSDSFIRHVLALACAECGYSRLPKHCSLVISQGTATYSTGRAFTANRYRKGYGQRRCKTIGGRVYVRASSPGPRLRKERGSNGGYIPAVTHNTIEDFVYVLAHEVRHVFQNTVPLYRECKKVRKYHGRRHSKLVEVDASLAGIRVLRRWRREGIDFSHAMKLPPAKPTKFPYSNTWTWSDTPDRRQSHL